MAMGPLAAELGATRSVSVTGQDGDVVELFNDCHRLGPVDLPVLAPPAPVGAANGSRMGPVPVALNLAHRKEAAKRPNERDLLPGCLSPSTWPIGKRS